MEISPTVYEYQNMKKICIFYLCVGKRFDYLLNHLRGDY